MELVRLLEAKGGPVLVNLGIGMSALVSELAAEEGVAQHIVTVLESGPWRGIALNGPKFRLGPEPFRSIVYAGHVLEL